MKRRFFSILLIMALAGIVTSACTSPTPSGGKEGEKKTVQPAESKASRSTLYKILETGKMRVGTTGDFNPMSFRDPATGAYIGYYIDVVELLAKDMGVVIQYVATDWKNLVSGLVADKYDITTGASYNMGRAKTAGYTLPIIEVGTVPMTLKEKSGSFTTWESINRPGVVVAVTLGTVFDEQARALFPKATIRAVEAPARDFQEVLSGRADVSITSNIEASQLVKTYPQLSVVPVDAPTYRNLNGMLVQQDDQIFINFLNVWILMKEKQGVLGTLRGKWVSLQ